MKEKLSQGFTIIELLVVIAIVGTLATFVIVQFTGAQTSARDTHRESDIKQYQTALEVYATRNNSIYPNNGGAGYDGNAVTLCATLGISGCPSDSKAGSTWPDYHYTSTTSGSDYVLWTKLEKTLDYFVVCSSGQAGNVTTQPSGSSCPI